MPKDYRIQVRVKNNLLLEAMEQAGYENLAALSRDADISLTSVYKFAALQLSGKLSNGEWRQVVIAISEVLGCLPEDIVPEHHYDSPLAINKGEFDASIEDITLLAQEWRAELPSPDVALERLELKVDIQTLLGKLSERERGILEKRFGLDEHEPMTLRELAKEYGVGPERIRQIEQRALRKLKHPGRNRWLREHLDGDGFRAVYDGDSGSSIDAR